MTDTDHTKIGIQFDPEVQRMSGTTYHGNRHFDVPYISPIDVNLWQGGCTQGLILPEKFSHLVSLYPWEFYTMGHPIDSELVVRMYDSEDQQFDQVDDIARWVNVGRRTGPVLVHCQAGLNRSSLIVARALMLSGRTADEAIQLLRTKRSPACLCNPSFEEWLRNSEDD